jgi:serine phosphatase RsbU (regulator of sigma subunit)
MTHTMLIDRLKSVHPQLKVLYLARSVWNLLLIPVVFSILYDLGKGIHYYILIFIVCLTYPHIAFYISAASRNPRRTETLINHPIEYAIFGFWLPILQFNPYLIMLGLVGLGVVAFTDKQTVIYVVTFRIIGFVIAAGISTAIFGFRFQTNIGLLSTICAGVFIVVFSYIHLIAVYRTTRKITFTRKEYKQALLERNEAYQKLNNELKVAESYVRSMLPNPIIDGCVKAQWLFQPSAILGGDAFGYYWLDDEHFAFYLLDVSGHGVGAALLSVTVLNDLRSKSLIDADLKNPHEVLAALNNTFPSDQHDDMFFTIWYGVFNKMNRNLKYASAGHPPAILIGGGKHQETEVKLLKTPNSVIGGFPGTMFNDNSLQIPNGNAIYVFSDGVYEVDKSDGTMWRFREFQTYLGGISPENGSRLSQLFTHVKSLSNSESLNDDFSIVEIVFE